MQAQAGQQLMPASVGTAPLVRLQTLPPPDSTDVYVKLEWFNPAG